MKTIGSVTLILLLGLAACNDKTTTPSALAPISIGSPVDGSILHDAKIIRALPGDGYSFTRIDFIIDGDSVASDFYQPYEYQWNIFVYPSGSAHSISATGFTPDTSYTAQPINITVEFASGFSFASTFRTSTQHAIGINAFQNVLFVSTGDAGLEILSIVDRTSPQFHSRFDTPGQALHSDAVFPAVYIADRDQGVVRANFSDIDTLIPTDTYNAQSLAIAVAVSDNYLFVAENDGLAILALSDLSSLSRIAISQDILNYVAARHDTAFVVGNNGFYVVDCTHPLSPRIVGTYNNLSLAKGVAVVDTFVFIANGSEGVMALSIDDPTSPAFLTRFNPGQIITTVAAGDQTLFAGANSGVLYALDYLTSGSMTLIDQFSASSFVVEIDYNDNYLFVAATSNVDIMRFVR